MKSNKAEFYFATPGEAESAFYSAFEMGDVQLMEAVLAEQGVCCVHPGSLPLVGREAVLDSWTQILSNSQEPVIYPQVINRSEFDDIAIHLVAERLARDHQPDSPTSLVLSTNVYVRQKNGWRLLEHHASLPRRHENEVNQDQERQATHEAPHTLQ